MTPYDVLTKHARNSIATAVILSVGACTSPQLGGDGQDNALGMGTKQTIGGILGAAGGGLLGSQAGHGTGKLALTGLGVVAGGLIGSSVGKSLDEIDRLKAAQAQRTASTSAIGETIAWNNPQTGHHGTVTATRDGSTPGGSYCREYQSIVSIGGEDARTYGTACQQPDGSWRVIN